MSALLPLHPKSRALMKQLDGYAVSGDFDVEHLTKISRAHRLHKCKMTVYYLASLYLQLGEEEMATELLGRFDKASREMKKYFHVLSYSRQQGLPIPRLTVDERTCIDYLHKVLNPAECSIEDVVMQQNGFTVVGNAPGLPLRTTPAACKFYFNNYHKNTRVPDSASIHVVTPSWQTDIPVNADCLYITGNDIFYRRSRVWKKFIHNRKYTSVYTTSRCIWRTLRAELGTSPSAGLVILALLAKLAERHPRQLTGFVAGFSDGQPVVNHAYDSEPASARHNWSAEAIVYRRLINELQQSCSRLTVEA